MQSTREQMPITPILLNGLRCTRCRRLVMHQWKGDEAQASTGGILSHLKQRLAGIASNLTGSVVGVCGACGTVLVVLTILGKTQVRTLEHIWDMDGAEDRVKNRSERRKLQKLRRRS